MADGTDARGDLALGHFSEAGVGLEHADRLREGLASGEDVVFGEKAVREPVLEALGGEWPGFVRGRAGGDCGPGVAGVRGKWRDVAYGVIEELLGEGVAHRFLWLQDVGACWWLVRGLAISY